PRQPPGGQDRSDPELGVGACLRQELGPIAAVLAEPVQEQDPGPNPAVGRLDDVRLHPGIVAAQDLIDDAPRHGGHCATGTYDQRVLDFEVPTIRLTELTTCGGCAAKLGADALAEALSGLGIDDGLDGAASKVREAGGILAGGHTIRDPEPKYGLAVIGVAAPDRLLRKGGAEPGDVLVLTKPLGTGLLVSGRRRGRTSDADLDAAIGSMGALNRRAAEVLVEHGLRGATDATGFGSLGHG